MKQALLLCATLTFAAASPHAAALSPDAIRTLLTDAPRWTVDWRLAATGERFAAQVMFATRDGQLYARTWHPDGRTCYPEIAVPLLANGFLFFGCTGVPKEMHYDPADAGAPFKGRAFGYAFRWTPAAQ